MNTRMMFLAVVAGIVVATSGLAVYAATWRPNLGVTDGSITGVIKGNLTSLGSATNPLFLYFNATTYGNQSGYPASALEMRIRTTVFYQVLSTTDFYAGYVYSQYEVTVLGRLASNLRPNQLLLRANDTVTRWDSLNLLSVEQAGTNVSFDPNMLLGYFGTGAGTVPLSLVNADSAVTYYDFEYHATFEVHTRLGGEPFVGFRASVEGLPSEMSVGIFLGILNVPGGT